MPEPRVSVVVPSYNRANFLPETIESILAQTFEDFELLFIDDGSTDSTEAVMMRYVDADSRVKYIKKQNQERAIARSYGISLALGEYVALVDSDDLWYPNKLAEQVALLDTLDEVVLTYAAVDRIDMQSQKLPAAPRQQEGSSGTVFFDLLKRNFVPSVTPLIRRSTLLEVGDQVSDYIPYEDWDFWLRISRKGRFYFQAKALGAYRIHPQQSVQNVNPQRIEDVTIKVLNANIKDECLEEYIENLFPDGAPETKSNFPNIVNEAYSLAYLRIAYWYLLAGDTDSCRAFLERSARASMMRRKDYRWHGLYFFSYISEWGFGVGDMVKEFLGSMH